MSIYVGHGMWGTARLQDIILLAISAVNILGTNIRTALLMKFYIMDITWGNIFM